MNIKSEGIALSVKDLNNELFNDYGLENKVTDIKDLEKIESLEELFGPDFFRIIYIGNRVDMGHFCCIFHIDDNNIEFFDSYGILYQEIIDFCERLDLFCIYNKEKLQSDDTFLCGQYCLLKINSFPLKNKHLIDILKCNSKKTPDEIVYSLYKIKRKE